MTERLEEIKAQYHLLTRNGYDLGAWDEPFSWLIKQAEYVVGLKEQSHGIELNLLNDEVVRLEKQNQRYKQALELIEDELEYAKTTGNDVVRYMYINNSIRFINEALEREG